MNSLNVSTVERMIEIWDAVLVSYFLSHTIVQWHHTAWYEYDDPNDEDDDDRDDDDRDNDDRDDYDRKDVYDDDYDDDDDNVGNDHDNDNDDV